MLVVMLAVLWFLLLIMSTSVGGSSGASWLLGVGAVGMLHNISVAAWPRKSGMHGVHMEYKECFIESRVFETLMKVEEAYPGMGRNMVNLYFPNGIMREEESRIRAIESGRASEERSRATSTTSFDLDSDDMELQPLRRS